VLGEGSVIIGSKGKKIQREAPNDVSVTLRSDCNIFVSAGAGIGETREIPQEFRQNDHDKTVPGAGYFELRKGVSEVSPFVGREHSWKAVIIVIDKSITVRAQVPAAEEDTMAKKDHKEHHEAAAEHHESAAEHHREAAKHYEVGHHEKAAHHAHLAHGHGVHATHHAQEAAKHHVEHHDDDGEK
jgi:hypothetical protein